MAYGVFGVGVLLLLLGSEALLHGGIGLTKSLGLPPLLIGLLVVTAATSAPELAVALEAARAQPDVTLGVVVGGNIVNILLVLGLGSLLRPLPSPPKVAFRDGGALLAASLALVVISFEGTITRRIGIMLVGGFVAYVVLTIATEWRRPVQLSSTEVRANCRDGDRPAGLNFILTVLGAALVFVGARFVIQGGLAVGQIYNLPQPVVGLTVVALATALPEFVVTLLAFLRRYTDAAVSHVIVSNIFHILVVLGVVALIHPLPVKIDHADIYVMAGSALLLMPLMIMSWRLSRVNGVFLMLCYGAYIAFIGWRLGYVVVPHLG
ncbi:MAG TPA: calcium/sodium antiporter [Rhizomicrobium sp.]|jgi:cation:H+ antiporter